MEDLLANYASMGAGLLLVDYFDFGFLLAAGLAWFWVTLACVIGLGVMVEWPFFGWGAGGMRKALRACGVANLATNLVLVVLVALSAWVAEGFSAWQDWTCVQSRGWPSVRGWIYYVRQGEVFRIALTGRQPQHVARLPDGVSRDGRLAIVPRGSSADLVWLEGHTLSPARTLMSDIGLARQAPMIPVAEDYSAEVLAFRDEAQDPVRNSYWMITFGAPGGPGFSLETPLIKLHGFKALTRLPDGSYVMSAGGYLLRIDPLSRHWSSLGRGQWPSVLLDADSAPPREANRRRAREPVWGAGS